MSRWPPDARARLVEAAVALYGEQGFHQTTAAEVAARAGLTERTFFRHFADKREVLFSGEVDAIVTAALAEVPSTVAPLDAIVTALGAPGDLLAERRDAVRRRQEVIAAHPSLQERELIKLDALAAELAVALRGRGVPSASADLTARAGVAVFKSAFDRWLAAERPFADVVRETVADLRAVTAPESSPFGDETQTRGNRSAARPV